MSKGKKQQIPTLTELVRRDFESMMADERLDTEEGVQELILIQSVEGHAHQGAGAFHKRRFTDMTTHEAVRLMGWPVEDCRLARQGLIDEVIRWVQAYIDGNPRDRLVDEAGHPLLRVPWLVEITVDPLSVLRGLYMGGWRDDEAVRARAEKAYNIAIGGGRCYVVDTRVMRKLGEDADKLAHEPHDAEEMQLYRDKGMIVPTEKIKISDVDDGPYEYYYIRYRVGPGHSDDASIVGAGLLYDRDVALGAWLADAVDTLEKFSGAFHDQDDELAEMVENNVPEARIPEEELMLYVALCSIALGKEERVPDSSTRHLIAIDEKTNRSLLRSHIDFVEGVRGPAQPMSHGKTNTHDFYAYLVRQLGELQRRQPKATQPAVEKPEAAIEISLISPLISSSYAVVSPEITAEEARRHFVESSVEVLVVCGADGRPRGIIRPRDVLASQ
ncbi:hypothetical protein K8R78_08515 [bacterium]|nr:hypothetical protein [bacterium]